MMLKCLLILICVVTINGCNTDQKKTEGDGTISYNLDLDKPEKPILSHIFSSIEIDTMEYSDQSIVGRPFSRKYYIYVPNKYHIFTDHRHVINIFNLKGDFISSSIECMGEGPNQYNILQDLVYNSYANTIEILDVFGTIYIYDLDFKFLSKHKIQAQSKEKFRLFYPLSIDTYALIDGTEKSTLYLYNLVTNKSKKIMYEGLIAPLTANFVPIREYHGTLYFFPPEINNYIFTFDLQNFSLSSKYYIESRNSIDKDDINKFKGNSEEISTFIESNSVKYALLNRFISDQYMYTWLIKQNKQFINLFNLKTKRNITFSKDPSYDENIPICHYMEGDTMFAVIQPYQINDFIDYSLLVNKDILLSINEEGNPIIVKYKIKI